VGHGESCTSTVSMVPHSYMIMTRVVREKIPQAERWSVPKDFKSWIDGLDDNEFKAYLDRLSVLTRNLSDEETPQEVGVFCCGKVLSSSEDGNKAAS